MWFMDEKLFTVTPPVNLQNDRVYVAVPMRKNKLQPIDCFVLVQISLNPSWFQSGYQVLAAQSSSLSIQGSKLMAHTIVTFYLVSTYCLLLKNCRAVNFSYSSRTVLQLTEPEKLWICFQEKLQILFHPLFGPPNRPDLNLIDYKI